MKKLALVALDNATWILLALCYLLIYPPSAAPTGVVVLVCLFWAALFFPVPLSYRFVAGVRHHLGASPLPYRPRWFSAPVTWPPLPAAILSVATLLPACLWHAVAAHEQDPVTGAWMDTILLLGWTVLWSIIGPDVINAVFEARRRHRRGESSSADPDSADPAPAPSWRADGRHGWSRPRRRPSVHDAALLNAETIHIRRPDGRS